MLRRSLGGILWALVGVLTLVLAAPLTLVHTGAGRDLLGRLIAVVGGDALAGRVEVHGVTGGLYTNLVLTDVRLYDLDTSLVAWLPRAEVHFSLLDFAAGRVVLDGVSLDRPYINLVQHRAGRLNFEQLLHLREPAAPGSETRRATEKPKPPPLILFRNVRITHGDVVVRLQQHDPIPAGSRLEFDHTGNDGIHRIRRFEGLNTDIAMLRIQSPRERGILVLLRRLAVTSTDPPLVVTGAEGRVLVDGDSLQADLRVVRLPGSLASLHGQVSWPRDTIRYNLHVAADRVALADARFIDRRFPDDAVLRGPVHLHSLSGRLLEVRLDSLDLLYHGGRVRGRVTALADADSGIVALSQADLDARDLDLNLPRVFLDTLPFYGHLTGRTQADGSVKALSLTTDWVFRDSLVPGWPTTALRGHGTVDLRSPAGLTFVDFRVDSADLAMGTLRRLAPTIALTGRSEWQGTLNGPLRHVTFAGRVRHRDAGKSSVAQGRIGLDTRAEPLGLDVDVSFDTLSFDDLRASWPDLPLRGTVTGTMRLSGRVDSLETHVDLSHLGEGGRIRGDGELVLLPTRVGMRRYRFQGAGLDLRAWVPRAANLPTALNFTLNGSFAADSGVPPASEWTGALAPSVFVGAAIDTAWIRGRTADGILTVDSLMVRRPGLAADAAGTLVWRRPVSEQRVADALTVHVDADSLIGLDSLYALLAGDTTRPNVSGAGQVTATITGALDSLAVVARGTIQGLELPDWSVRGGDLSARYEPGPHPAFAVSARTDSVAHGSFGFGGASADVGGTPDSIEFAARTRIGDLSAVFATGRYLRTRDGYRVQADSFGVLLPGGVWFLERPAELEVRDSAIMLRDVAMRPVHGDGRLDLSAAFPDQGPVSGHLTAREVPVAGVLAVVELDTLGIGGRLSADVAVTGTRDRPEYRGSYRIAYDSTAALGAVPELTGSLAYADGWAEASLAMVRRGRAVIDVSAHLPVDLSLRPVARRLRSDTLVVQAKADHADIGVLQALTPNVEDLRGTFTADVGVRGAWDAPRLQGRFQIDSGGVTIPSLNVRYEEIAGRFSLGGDTVLVDTLRIRSGRGLVNVGGLVRFADLSHPILALTLAARDFRALDVKNEMAVTATAQLHLTGPLVGATLSGRGTVTSGLLYFGDLVTKRIINLDAPDPWIASLIDTALAATIRRGRLGPTLHNRFLDSLQVENLHLNMGSDVWLRSSEANIQLAGEVTMNKAQQNYLLSGTLQATRGTYRLLVGPISRDFQVSRGTVHFFGTPDLDAGLDIQARHVVRTRSSSALSGDTLTVLAQITGTLLVPKLTLRSVERDLSQTDIISYLLFNQSNADLASDPSTSSSSSLVSNTVASLVSGELERTLVSDIGVPIDYVEIRPGDPHNPLYGARVTAGWQVGEKAFLVVKAGVCPGAQTSVVSTIGWGLQYRISPEWGTEASVEPVTTCNTPGAPQTTQTTERQVGLDFYWQRRF